MKSCQMKKQKRDTGDEGDKGNNGNTGNRLEQIIYVSWEESERGWGTRPDGCSLHLSKESYEKYLNEYSASLPAEVPDEYSRPAGEPVIAYASNRLYNAIKSSKYGLRLWESEESEAKKYKNLVYGKERSGWVDIE